MRSVCFKSRNCDGSDTIIARARVLKNHTHPATARAHARRAGACGCALIRVSAVKRCWRVLCPLFGGVRYLECPLFGSFKSMVCMGKAVGT